MDNSNYKVSSYKEWENIGCVLKEVTEDITMGSEKITKKQKAQDYRFWNGKKYRIRTGTNSARLFTPGDHFAPELCETLDWNPTQIGYVIMIIRNMDRNNMIMYYDRHTKTAIPANKELLYKFFSKNPNSAWRAVKPLLEKGIIREWTSKWKGGKTERYYINPLYTMRDSGITLDLYKLFKEELDPVLTDRAKKDLGTLLYYDCHPEELLALKEKELKELKESFDLSIEDMLEEMKANCESQQDEAEEEAAKEEYTIEHGGVINGFFNRKVFIPVNDDYDAAKDSFIAERNNTDVYYCAYAHEDKDNDQSKLYGGLYIDLDSHSALESEEGFQNIVEQARNVVAFFRDEMSVPVDMQEVFFSGSKGFHITISPEVFGILPTKNLNKEFKAIAQKIETECAPAVDTVIYDRRRLFRYPNSINGKTGLYKVPVSHEMLNSGISLGEMKAWASQPREIESAKIQTIQEAVEAYQKLTKEATIKVAKKTIKKAPVANSLLLPCIQSMLDNGAEVGQRNNTTVALASGLLQANYSYEEVVETLTEWNNDCNAEPLSETELMNTINSAHQMFLAGTKYGCTRYNELG